VAYEGFIKDLVNRGVIVLASLRQASQGCSLGWRKGRQVVCSIVIAKAPSQPPSKAFHRVTSHVHPSTFSRRVWFASSALT